MAYKYATQDYKKETMARGVGNSLPISLKHSIEICAHIKNMPLNKAKEFLQDVKKEKRAVPFRRFNDGVGHKPGIGPGRYPLKASTEILSLLDSIESNAQFKGLSTGNLIISHICAHKASTPMHHGRHRGRSMKRTHVEIVVKEISTKREDKPNIKTKTAIKPEEKISPVKEDKVEKKTEAKVEEKKPQIKEVEKTEEEKR